MPYPQTNLQLYAALPAWPPRDLRRVRDAYELARLLFSARYRGSGKPFLAHLVGTAGILLAHGEGVATVCAGLLHAAYLQGDFGAGGRRSRASRARVARAAGADAEEIVWRYASFRWDDPDADPRVLLVRIANELEEMLDLGLLHAGPRKREAAQRTAGAAIAAAERIGLPALARELREAWETTLAGVVPAELADGHGGSYEVRPLSLRRRLLCRARRLLER